MTKLIVSAALGLLSTIASTQVFAQSFGEPAAFAAQHPDRDVLNGGALTPEARAAAGLDRVKGVDSPVNSINSASARRTLERFRR
jgi:hypothetical protein